MNFDDIIKDPDALWKLARALQGASYSLAGPWVSVGRGKQRQRPSGEAVVYTMPCREGWRWGVAGQKGTLDPTINTFGTQGNLAGSEEHAQALADQYLLNKRVRLVGEVVAMPDLPEPQVLSDLLSLVMEDPPPPEQVATWDATMMLLAEGWAAALHLYASDNDDVEVPEKPEFLDKWPEWWRVREELSKKLANVEWPPAS